MLFFLVGITLVRLAGAGNPVLFESATGSSHFEWHCKIILLLPVSVRLPYPEKPKWPHVSGSPPSKSPSFLRNL